MPTFWCTSQFSVHIVLFATPLQVAYKKDAKANLHYTTVADRPDIRKATQAAKLISEVSVGYGVETALHNEAVFAQACFHLLIANDT